jgi:hypothetical protein
MSRSLIIRRGLIWTVGALAAFCILAAALIASVDAGYGRGLLIRYFASRVGRSIHVNGQFQAHIFSFTPRLIAEQVTIDNPRWMPAGVTAEIGKLSLTFKLPGFDHPSGIVALEMDAATLHLVRDSAGSANWQLTDPAKSSGYTKVSIVRSLSIPNAHLELADARRHLQFDGTVSAQDLGGTGSVQPLRIEGAGQLNGKAVSFQITADALAAASHQNPYHFTFSERSTGSRLDGTGVLPRPFDFATLETAFDATGPDLKDLYFLTGVTLLDTGRYHLAGRLSRRGTRTDFSDLAATFGQSDMRGTVSIESSGDRPKFNLDLNSRRLRLLDLGARAAGRSSEPKSPLLLSNAALSPDLVRRDDATVRFQAQRVDLGRLPLREVSIRATIEHGVLTVAPLLAQVLGGRANAYLRLDAGPKIPKADVDIRITDLQVGQIDHKGTGPPAWEGPMQARVTVTGAGSSAHQIAASANGMVWAQISHGTIRDSFAELTGIDLRGLGLLLTKSHKETSIRCATASFKAHEGTLIAQSLIVDTDPVLITGEGQIQLESEAVDLEIRGHPKSLRLFRLRTPVLVRGTLAHPTVDIKGNKPVLVIADPGRAKDLDCAALPGAA